MRRLLAAGLVVAAVVARRADAAATVRAIRHITAPATTRLIVECSAPVHYRLQRVAPRPNLGVPARLYVDFLDSTPSDPARQPLDLDEGPLLRLRATQAAGMTRLILDVPGLTEFGAFPMPDPFRLIIDVRGTSRAAAPAPKTPNVARGHEGQAESPSVVLARPALPTPPAPTPASPSRRHFKIVVDPGHGGKDPGALSVTGTAEKEVVLSLALRLRDRLSAAAPDVDVVLTRTADVFLALEERTARANAEGADLFLSIHANASPNRKLSGVETYYLNNTDDRGTIRLAEMENGLRTVTGRPIPNRAAHLIVSDLIQSYKIQESVSLAEDVQHGLVTALNAQAAPINDLGVKRGPFYVLVGAGMPCVLVEVAFLTHPQEGVRLEQRAYQEAIAEGLLRGIMRFVENSRMAENL
jgi:N-acetylmuramoyl-L-alanine amidase